MPKPKTPVMPIKQLAIPEVPTAPAAVAGTVRIAIHEPRWIWRLLEAAETAKVVVVDSETSVDFVRRVATRAGAKPTIRLERRINAS